MEFDTSLSFKPVLSESVASDKDLETFVHDLWTIAGKKVKYVAEAGEGELWMDYSDSFRTRHMVCNVSEADGGYTVSFRSGSKPGLWMDVVIIALVLAAFWCLSKAFVPQPPVIFIAGLVVAIIGAVALTLYCGKTFGKEEATDLLNEIK